MSSFRPGLSQTVIGEEVGKPDAESCEFRSGRLQPANRDRRSHDDSTCCILIESHNVGKTRPFFAPGNDFCMSGSSLHEKPDSSGSIERPEQNPAPSVSSSGIFQTNIAAARLGFEPSLGRILESCRAYLLFVGNHAVGQTIRGKVGASDLAPVRSVSCTSSESYTITLDDGPSQRLFSLVGYPGLCHRRFNRNVDPGFGAQLRNIPYSSTANVSLAFKREEIPHPLNGSGFLVPRKENRTITACTWSSVKFEDRAPEGFVLLRVFLGGGRLTNLTRWNDDDLINLALRELRSIIKIMAPPVLAKTFRWINGAPQYEVGHASRVDEIERLTSSYPGLYLAGAAYRGGGVPDCVRSGIEQAQKIIDNVARERNDAALVA